MGALKLTPEVLASARMQSLSFPPKHVHQYPGAVLLTREWFARLPYLSDDQREELATWPADVYEQWSTWVEYYADHGDTTEEAEAHAYGTVRGLFLVPTEIEEREARRGRFAFATWEPRCSHCGSHAHEGSCSGRALRVAAFEGDDDGADDGADEAEDDWSVDLSPMTWPEAEGLDAWGAP